MYNFAESLKEHRLSRGLTLMNIEKATGISNANLSRWENNQTIPNIDFCIQPEKENSGCPKTKNCGRCTKYKPRQSKIKYKYKHKTKHKPGE